MKITCLLLVALIASSQAVPASSPSICDFYATATGMTTNTLLTTIVTNAVTAVVGDANLKFFFDGTIATTTNFTSPANAAKLTTLIQHLVQFFAMPGVLNCTIDATIGPYAGNPNMVQVHARFPITVAQFTLFNNYVIGAATALGVTGPDAVRIRILLDSTRYVICNNEAACNPGSICDKYAIALGISANSLLTTIVNGVVTAALGSTQKRFFDGSIAGTTNFTDPNQVAKLNTLVLHFVQFLAQAGVLTCTDTTVGVYQGKAMRLAHQFLPIHLADFNQFNGLVLTVLGGLGVTPTDQAAILTVLQSTQVDICNQPDCVATPTPKAGVSVFGSLILLLAALIVLFS